MAYLATKRFTYLGQLAILVSLALMGWVIGGFVSLVAIFDKIDPKHISASLKMVTTNLIRPENAGTLRWMQFISTLFLFFLPPVLYAWICHKKPFVHLGFKPVLNLRSASVVLLIMLAALPMVSFLQDLTEKLPWSKETLLTFKAAEAEYNKTVSVIAKMDNFTDYLISLLVIALLPAVFEETLFRGGIQNLLSRWTRAPVLGIVLTSVLFSAVHLSYLGFLSRFALGFVLGWMYYRTGNIWLNILGHFFNNAFAVTALYITSHGGKVDASKLDERFPLWLGLGSIAIVYGLFKLFEKMSEREIVSPGEELQMPGVPYSDNPFIRGSVTADQSTEIGQE